ncbi:MAG TPA: pantetheine-phosphate adenylyltransferase [Gemmatales bacterium]|nr:pantetheine-phosphate adenylyltransferase [Gemmatales bacterium]
MPDQPARIAVYPGMFDPVHLGHLDVIRRAALIFPKLVVAVGVNPVKQPLFSAEDRVEMLRLAVQSLPNVEVKPFDTLAVRFVRNEGGMVMIRGLRTVTDMDYEFSMSLTNQTLDPSIQTIFLLSHVQYTHLSSTLIRQIVSFGGDLSKFLPAEIVPIVHQKIQNTNWNTTRGNS